MDKIFQIALLKVVFLGCFINQSFGQSKIDTVSLKKGEVLDILLLSQNPNTDAELKSYFQTALPVGRRMSYTTLPGFKIPNYSQGNLKPDYLVLSKWDDIVIREAFLSQITEEVDDFHERRRKIWSFFGLRYFEITENISFLIRRDQYQVATSFWLESENHKSKFYKKWKKEIKNSGGEILIQLKDGKSPFGYQYNPEYFIITSWNSKAEFDNFLKKMNKLEMDNIEHINEFILE